MKTRRYSLQLSYNGVSATEEIQPYFNSFTYTDPLDQSDTISVSLLDREGKWASSWIPQKEDVLKPEIRLENWLAEGELRTILCGDFMVDDFDFSGPPDMLVINGISAPLNTDFKERERSQTWKEVTLKQIEEEIAGRYGMTPYFEGEDVLIEKMEQSRQTDADFLKKLAEKYGFALKIYAGRMILFSWEVYEAKAAKGTIKKTDVRKWKYHSSMMGTYTGAIVTYTDPSTKQTTEVIVGKEGRLYSSMEKADSPADAERIGKNAVRNANRKETTITLTMNPVFFFSVSDNVMLEGFGKADGRYQIGKIVHQVSKSDYTIQVSGWRLPEESSESMEGAETQDAEGKQERYVVKSGDDLWKLAERFYQDGTKESTIYEANKAVIEEAARKHGMGTSSSGYWIFPGTELIIP